MLPNAASRDEDQAYRFEYVALAEGGKRRAPLRLGMLASEQKKWVATNAEWQDLQYRIDLATGPCKVGETPKPVHPGPTVGAGAGSEE